MTLAELPGEIFSSPPVVYAVGDEYQIFVIPSSKTVMWCRIGENEYYDHANGVLRSETSLHKITVPAAELDAAGSYTIGYRRFQERVSYFNKADLEGEVTFKFRKVNRENPKFYLLSDVHSRAIEATASAKSVKDLDFLIMNGDIQENSSSEESLLRPHRIASEITRGEIPVIYSRGNHDLRGPWAERVAEFFPNANGKSYYTFRLGNTWGIVLDCGEDKPDASVEYGGVNCCHPFRLEETRYLEKVIANAANEYAAPGVVHKMIVAHINFSEPHPEPFNIEYPIYSHWCALIRENIKPSAYFYGHTHKNYVTMPGTERDIFNQGSPAILTGVPGRAECHTYNGAAITLNTKEINVSYINESGECIESIDVALN